MDLHRPGWLQESLGSILSGYDPAIAEEKIETRASVSLGPRQPRALVLAHLEEELRRTGLVYGFPKLPSRVSGGRRLDRNEAHFLAVLASKSFLVLDVARLCGVPFDRGRAEAELTLFLAATAGRFDLAEGIRRALRAGEVERELPALQLKVERVLGERIPPVSGDIRFDLPLHNGVAFGEARVMGRLALGWHGGGGKALRRAHVAGLLAAIQRERLLLAKTLIAFTAERGRYTEAHRNLVRREIRRLRLPRPLDRDLREALGNPPSLREVARTIRTRSLRRFVLEQLVLSSILDGEEARSAELSLLASCFDQGEEEIARFEGEIAGYVYGSEDVFDAFEGRAAAQLASNTLVDRIAQEIALNLHRIQQEVRETGELTQLLAKAARGQKLDGEERAKMREQLADLAKVVPSLAILAAPGGMVIFAALLKVLPFSLLPSSFQSRPEPLAPSPQRPRRRARGKQKEVP